MEYDSYHCLLLMLYVSGLATVDFVGGFMLLCFSRHYTLFLLCGGGGGLCCYLIILIYMLDLMLLNPFVALAGRPATLK